jgi:hypothetical protein
MAAEIVRDRDDELDELELKGRITAADWQRVLACFADPEALGARPDDAPDFAVLLSLKYCSPGEIAAHGKNAR